MNDGTGPEKASAGDGGFHMSYEDSCDRVPVLLIHGDQDEMIPVAAPVRKPVVIQMLPPEPPAVVAPPVPSAEISPSTWSVCPAFTRRFITTA